MSLLKLIGSIILTAIIYAFIPSPIVLTLGICIAIGWILQMIYEEVEENFYVLSTYIVIVSLILSTVVIFIPDLTCRVITWLLGSFWVYGFCSGWTKFFSEHIYNKNLRWLDKKPNRNFNEYYSLKHAVGFWYIIKYFLYSSPFIIVSLILTIFIMEVPALSFISTAVIIIGIAIVMLMMYIRGIRPESNSSKREIRSFNDVFRSIKDYFVNKWNDFLYTLYKIKNFFKNLFKKKDKVKKEKKQKTIKYKKAHKRISFDFYWLRKFFNSVKRFFRNLDFSFITRIFKRRRYSYGGYYSKSTLIWTLVPVFVLLIFLILSMTNLVDPFANSLSGAVNHLTNNMRTLVISGFLAEEWLPKVGEAFWLFVIPYGLIVLACIVIGFVIDIVLLLLYLVFLLVLFIIAFIFAVAILYVVCPAALVVEIIMLVKVFRNDESEINKLWAVVGTILSIVFCILFYTWPFIFGF